MRFVPRTTPVISARGGSTSLKAVLGTGPKGDTGATGPTGPIGPPGPGTGAGAWQASTAYTAGQVVQAPDGSMISRNATGTSRASFDATEQAAWTAVLAKAGTVEAAALLASMAEIKAWAKNPDNLVAGALTYSSGLLAGAVVEWPDGLPGVLTITSRQSGTDAVTGYTITRVDGATTTTYTQPTITRDSSGNATAVPQITVA